MILHGDCATHLMAMEPDSVNSLVTDPPAGISFMGKDWDGDKGGRPQWIAWMTAVMQECLRVMKPGAHGLVWAIPRTSHWTATACENAGFEIRDVVTHLFGSGFPKSLDVSKAIDKAAGVAPLRSEPASGVGFIKPDGDWNTCSNRLIMPGATTDDAKTWRGWGTALKPASEHWILIRKPCSEKTVAKNVLRWGTGAINIDGCRVGTEVRQNAQKDTAGWSGNNWSGKPQKSNGENKTVAGRFPANLVLDQEAAALLDEQSGHLHGPGNKILRDGGIDKGIFGKGIKRPPRVSGICDSAGGGASRFFYVAKASKKDKGADNTHPTVKSTALMRYLIRLITPPGGLVLDPFAGSGSTGVAAIQEGFRFLGIEKDSEYIAIAKARMEATA